MLAVCPNLLRSPTLLARARQHRKDKSMPLRGGGLDAPLTRRGQRRSLRDRHFRKHPRPPHHRWWAKLQRGRRGLGHAVAPDIGVPTAHNPVPASQERRLQSPLRPAQGNARSARERAPQQPLKRARLPTSAQPGDGSPPGPSGCTLSRAAEPGRLALEKISVAPLAVRAPRWALRLAPGGRPQGPPRATARRYALPARSAMVADRRSAAPATRWEVQPAPRAQNLDPLRSGLS